MLVYNIRKAKYANSLKASGVANRWNKEEEFVIYTGATISLSILELLAHRNGIDINTGYKLLTINLAIDNSAITEIATKDLPKNWVSIESYPILQQIGSEWYRNNKSLVLKVPSALVRKEYNYLINAHHPDFSRLVSIESAEDFIWDSRLL